MIPLVCGNPAEKLASYTRFVLPFSYSPAKYSSRKGASWVSQPSKPASTWRKNYLTVETAAVFFDRARWFELEGKDLPWQKVALRKELTPEQAEAASAKLQALPILDSR